MVDYLKALLFPFTDKKNIINFVIGAVINIVWFLILPLFFVWGYLIKIIQHTLQEKEDMPSWKKPLEIFRHGFIVFAILIGYFIIPLLIGFLGLRFTGDVKGIIADPTQLSMVPGYATGLVLLSGIITALIWFILPMALINYAATEDIRQAFNFKEILARLRKRLAGYLITYLITLVTFIFVLVTLFVPYAQIISGIIMFYALIFIIHTFSQIYAEAENL